jgi:hypothetical protein
VLSASAVPETVKLPVVLVLLSAGLSMVGAEGAAVSTQILQSDLPHLLSPSGSGVLVSLGDRQSPFT